MLQLTKNYNRYFSSGTYRHRYPQVNRNTLSTVLDYLDQVNKQYSIIDYGCGDGRYLRPLLKKQSSRHFIAFDIAKVPLEELQRKLDKDEVNQVTLTQSMSCLNNAIESHQPVGIVLALFGVLSHISSLEERQTTLSSLHNALDKDGYLILSVPNKKRRFQLQQKEQKSDDITYTREIDGEKVEFFYHLYDVDSIEQELLQAGYKAITMQPESFFPEFWITHSRLLGWIDHQLCKVLPAQWGYGILVSCQRQ